MLPRGGSGGEGGLPSITKWASGGGRGGIVGTGGLVVALLDLTGTIGLDLDVSVLSGLGGGMGGVEESWLRTAIPGPPRGVDVRCIRSCWTPEVLLLLLLLMLPPSVVVGTTTTTGGIRTECSPSCIAANFGVIRNSDLPDNHPFVRLTFCEVISPRHGRQEEP